MHPNISRGLVLSLLLTTGCYESFLLGEAVPPDAGSDVGFDARLIDGAVADVDPDAPDADIEFDADSDVDAQVDATLDADAGPPPPPNPPDINSCRIVPEVFPFDDPVLEYEWPEGVVSYSDKVHVSMTPLVIDLDPTDGDDLNPQLVFISYGPLGRNNGFGVLRIVDPVTNTTITYPADGATEGILEATGSLAAGDIDGDGKNEIIGLGQRTGMHAFRHDGTLMWSSPFPDIYERNYQLGNFGTFGGGVSIADLDGDGNVEIIAGHTVVNGQTGEMIWHGEDEESAGRNSFIGPLPCVADLDLDGKQEVIAGDIAYRSDGTVMWANDPPQGGLCAIADVHPSPGPEVVLTQRGRLVILNGLTGENLLQRALEGTVTLRIGGAPTVADFDGDGRAEIGVANGGAYAVYDLDCVTPGTPGCVGETVLWKSDTSDASSSGTGSSVFDFNGDGKAEVVYNDEYYFRIYDGPTGRTLFEHKNSSRTRAENPVIADVDNDGDAEIVFSANSEARFLELTDRTDPGVEIWGDARGRWVGARRIWNQHQYHITNVEEDGSIPTNESPSWQGLNAYRQNLREGGDVLVTPDLWGGQGSYECTDDGPTILSVTVANFGLERAGAGAIVGFYKGDPALGNRVGEAQTTRVLQPGGDSEVLSVQVQLSEPVEDYFAVIDEEQTIFECREGNNQVLIWKPFCG